MTEMQLLEQILAELKLISGALATSNAALSAIRGCACNGVPDSPAPAGAQFIPPADNPHGCDTC